MIFDTEALCRPVFCVEITQEPGRTLRLPVAPLVVVLVSRGRAAFTVQEKAFLLSAGGVLAAQGAVEITIAASCHLLAAGFSGLAAQAAIQALKKPVASDALTCPQLGQAMAELCAAYERMHAVPATDATGKGDSGEDARAHRNSTLSALGYAVLCAVAQADAATVSLPPLVSEAILAMRENYAALYGVEELSTQLGVSKSHLVRVFSAAMGTPPGQYLTRVRIDATRRLLLHREYTLDIVASLCGFSGANYLCKVFKKETGLTPAAYRAQNAGRADPHDKTGAQGAALAHERNEPLNERERALYIE